jgi:hypothetical protein
MNRSFSKIRHIQEANQRLEKRLMSEQVQTTVTQTGKNPGMKTTVNPPMSRAISEIPGDTSTITNPYKDQSLLNKFVGKQFNTYTTIENKKLKPDSIGNNSGTYEIEKAYFGVNNDVTFKVNMKNSPMPNLQDQEASFNCNAPDRLTMSYYRSITGEGDRYVHSTSAPSLTKELKQTFCTTGAGNQSVPKVDYPTP